MEMNDQRGLCALYRRHRGCLGLSLQNKSLAQLISRRSLAAALAAAYFWCSPMAVAAAFSLAKMLPAARTRYLRSSGHCTQLLGIRYSPRTSPSHQLTSAPR